MTLSIIRFLELWNYNNLATMNEHEIHNGICNKIFGVITNEHELHNGICDKLLFI